MRLVLRVVLQAGGFLFGSALRVLDVADLVLDLPQVVDDPAGSDSSWLMIADAKLAAGDFGPCVCPSSA